nr:zinc finger, CCHC-type [Tanacetum cinerariifolium]
MGDVNPIRTLRYYSKPSHEGYGNTIELPDGNNMLPLRSDTIREEGKYPVTKNINSISLTRLEEEYNDENDVTTVNDIKKLTDQGSNINILPLFTYMKLTGERPTKTDIRLSLASHSYIYPLGIAKDVFVDVVGIPESLSKVKKGIKDDIEPIAPTMTVNMIVLEWEERIKLHQKKEMEFNQWRSKNFKNKHLTLVEVKGDANLVHTLGDYSKPIHKGYRNTIELPEGNNAVPLRSDTIRVVQNGCLFHGLWSVDPNQHLKDFLKLVDSLDLDGANRKRTFKNAIFKQQEEINDRMAEFFGLLKELITSMAPKKVLIREEAKYPVTKNINSISLTRREEEKNDKNDVTTVNDIEKTNGSDTKIPVKKTEKENKAKN